MKSVLRHTRAFAAATALVSLSGCAHQARQQAAAQHQQEVAALQARLDEAERTNGRLTVRIEELEDAVFLLQDRVDANRIALQRRGIMGPQATGNTYAATPVPTPETHWNSPPPAANPYVQEQKPVTRIPLGTSPEYNSGYDQPYAEQVPTNQIPTATTASPEDAEIVIGENEFRAFEQKYGDPRATPSSSSSKTRAAQPPVTDERLPTTEELGGGEAKDVAPKAPATRKDALSTYKDALADYRGGNYKAALTGFESFLASSPQADYVDNALYWIGECHFGLGHFEDAVNYFQRVMSEQPDGNKVPDAMLKMSLAYDRTGRGDQARRLLEDLTRQFPATNAGRLATQKLAERP